jgi:hypothetical protein
MQWFVFSISQPSLSYQFSLKKRLWWAAGCFLSFSGGKMNLNKTQKIILSLALLAMAVVVLFPEKGYWNQGYWISARRSFIFNTSYLEQINVKRMGVEILAIAIVGLFLIIAVKVKL